MTVGSLTLDPGGLLSWIIVGFIAGVVAGRVVHGRGYGCLTDVVLGVAGALIGGVVVSYFVKSQGQLGFIGTLLVALFGAVLLLAVVRLVSRE